LRCRCSEDGEDLKNDEEEEVHVRYTEEGQRETKSALELELKEGRAEGREKENENEPPELLEEDVLWQERKEGVLARPDLVSNITSYRISVEDVLRR
jgi:hypothetical protein